MGQLDKRTQQQDVACLLEEFGQIDSINVSGEVQLSCTDPSMTTYDIYVCSFGHLIAQSICHYVFLVFLACYTLTVVVHIWYLFSYY